MDWCALPSGDRYTLKNVSTPACLLGQPGDLIRIDITIEDGKISERAAPELETKGGLLLPAFTDMHTHIDKGHIWPRSPNPDGTFMGALNTVAGDREARWSAEDVYARAIWTPRTILLFGMYGAVF